MTSYTYHTSDKSYLDNVHEPYWNSAAAIISSSFPWMTPNIVTLIGVCPIFILFGLYISQIIDPITAYTLLSFALIIYVNMDAIDGKLARLTGTSSPYGQMVDHGCDSIAIGCITFMILGHIDYLESSYIYRVLVFFALISIYIAQLMCNITEFYTGKMIVSVASSVGTTELIYVAAVISFILSRLYYLGIESLSYLIQIICSLAVVSGSVIFTYYTMNILLNPVAGSIKKGTLFSEENRLATKSSDFGGTETEIRVFDISDIRDFVVITGLSMLIVHFSGFTVHEIIITIIHLASPMIDIVFSNGLKKNVILFDNNMLYLLCAKCVLLLLFGSGFITTMIDGACISQFCYDKLKKRAFIIEKYKLDK